MADEGDRTGRRRLPGRRRASLKLSRRSTISLLIAGGVVLITLAVTLPVALGKDSPTSATPSAGTSSSVSLSVADAPNQAPSPTATPLLTVRQLKVTHPAPIRKLNAADERLLSLHLTPAQEKAPTTFTMASFNVLGAQHTSCKKKNVICQHPTWATGASRMRSDLPWINSQGFSIIGFQELEGEQYNAFMAGEPAWEGYPGTLPGARVDNTVAWDTRQWNVVEEHLLSIPYFYGKPVGIPYVLLQNIKTGREVWVLNTHNPANTHGNAQGWRVQATAAEIKLINELAKDGTPVLFTGDMNERQSFGCRVTAAPPDGAGLHASNGGDTTKNGTCQVASNTPIDWVLGTSQVTFSGDVYDTWALSRHLSDHAVTRTTATIAGLTNPPVAAP